MPVEREEQNGTVVVVGEDVYRGVNHRPKDEGQPPMSACADFVHEAPEQDGVDDKYRWRMLDIVRGNPPGVVEV